MPVPTSAVKVNPVTGALIDPPVATFAAANGLLTDGTSDAKNSVRAATTTNGTLATEFENGDTIDGIVLATSDRILIKNQSAPAENGIYVVAASGAPARATDFDAWTEIVGAFVSVEAGTVNAGTQWLCNVVAGGTLGTTAITFVVPKNYVDLTTAQTVSGAKTLSNVTTINGLSIIDGNTGFSPVPSGSVFAITGPSPATIEFYGEGASGAYSFSAGGSTFGFDLAITNPTGLAQVILRAPVAVDVTLPTSGTLLSTAAIGVSVQAYDADLTTWAGITPGANVGTFLATPSGANLASALTSALPETKGGTGLTALGVNVATQLADYTTEDVCSFREDFISGTNTDGSIGVLGWRIYSTAGTSAQTYVIGELNHPGIFRIKCGATSGNGQQIVLAGSGVVPFQDPTNGAFTMRFIFRIDATTSVRFRAGMGNGTTAIATRFFGVRFDTTQADTDFMVVAYNADGTENQASSLGVVANTNWNNAEIQQVSTTSIRARMNGGSWITISSEVPFSTLYLSPFALIETQTAAARQCDLDLIALSMTLTR